MELELSVVINALPGLVWTALLDGRAEFLNLRWCQFTGLSLAQAIGFGWHSAIHPQDLSLVLSRWRSLVESAAPGEIEVRLRRHDGEYRRFLLNAAPIADSSGRIVKWCGINTDIEERLRAREALLTRDSETALHPAHQHLIEAQRLSQTGSFTWDVARDEHVWSDEMCRIFEIDPATKITLQTGRDMILPDDRLVFEEAIERGIGGSDLDFDCRIVTARGSVKHVHAVAHRIEQITDRPVFIGAVRDVTENKLAEDALHKVRAELTHVARLMTLSALTASIAHEVNQPLSGIVTNAGTCLRILASEPPNLDGARTTAQRTLRDGNRASDVIQRLHNLFTHHEPSTGPVDLSDAAREVLSLSSSELQAHLRTERLRQELDGARLDGLNRHRDVAVAGNEDYRQVQPIRYALLQLQAVEVRQVHVEHKAAWNRFSWVHEELCGRGEHFRAPTRIRNEQFKRFTNRDVIVDDEYYRLRNRCGTRPGGKPRRGGKGVHCVHSAPRSAPEHCRIEGCFQFLLAEWLEQALHCALSNEVPAHSVIGPGSNENDFPVVAAARQLLLQLRPGHAGHGDVQDQATRHRNVPRRQELVRRRECPRGEPELPQQIRKRFAHRLVIVDDGHDRFSGNCADFG
jgi:PAS domain S-box-containing protein